MGNRYSHLSLDDRCRIACLQEAGYSLCQIAASLGRTPSTISREIDRNSGNTVGYKPSWADDLAWSRRWRGSKLERQPTLRHHVLQHLAMGWSPEQVAGRLTRDKVSPRISHESIYRFIHAQIARTKDGSWRLYLHQGKSRRGWGRRKISQTHRIKDRVCISKRPAYIERRKQIGHWEADLLHPQKSGACVLVAIERATLFVHLAKQDGKYAKPVTDQLNTWFQTMPSNLRRTLTQDNGPEFALHHHLHPLGLKTYFCKPHHPWEKGSVENMNGRLRRYIPLGTDPESFSNQDLIQLADRINNTPRKRLGFRTPAELFLPKLKPLHFKCESTKPNSAAWMSVMPRS
jgi:transposase, IS30 family